MLDWIAYVFSLISIGLLAYLIIGRNDLGRFFSVERLGLIEKDLESLDRVIVAADHVERPDSILANAVEDNMRQGVSYLFLVSKSRAEKELSSYYLFFEAIARVTTIDRNMAAKLIKIQKLPYDWSGPPYIFYRYRDETKKHYRTDGYRGNQNGKGIAEFYEKLPENQALMICSALLEAAPENIKMEYQSVSVTKLDEKIRSGDDAV